MKSILLFRLGGLGDLLVALPSANLLRRAFPGAALNLVGRRIYGELLLESRVVDAVFSADDSAWSPFLGGAESVPGGARPGLAGYDLVVGLFQQAGTAPFFGGRRESSPAIRAVRFESASGLSVSRYFFDRTAEFVRGVGAEIAPFETCALLPFPADAVPRRRSRSAVIHPGSGSPRKCWPLERFLSVMNVLQSAGWTGVLVTGEAEERMEADLRNTVFPPGWRWIARPPLAELSRLLRLCAAYLGNDSGVTHLAASCGADVVAIFRKEFVQSWSPFGRTLVLNEDDVNKIPERDVLAALTRRPARSLGP